MTKFTSAALAALTAGTIAISSLAFPASASPLSPVAAAPSQIVLNQAASEADVAPVVDVHWKRRRHSHARHNRRAAAAGIAGALIGAAIVGAASRERAPRESRYDRHVRRCYNAYRSYDEETDTWIDRRGRVRRCRL